MLLTGEVGDAWIKALLTEKDDSQIQPLLICSGGGDCDAARAVVDLLKMMPHNTVALGACCSAAIPVFAMGMQRLAYPSTVFLWHEPYEETKKTQLTRDGLTLWREALDAWMHWACRLLAKQTGKTAKFWENLGAGEGTHFEVADALDWGLISGVI